MQINRNRKFFMLAIGSELKAEMKAHKEAQGTNWSFVLRQAIKDRLKNVNQQK